MKITIEIRSEGGPVDQTVALAKRAARAVVRRAKRLRRRVARALRVQPPAPVLPPPALQAHQLAA